MNEPLFLSLDEVLHLHGYQIENFGGARGILDIGALESAIAMPRQTYGGNYLHEDMAAMAAAYLFHITSNHAFEDGNKRTGAHAAIAFLALNSIEADFPTDEMEQLTLGVARHEVTKEQVTEFFRRILTDR
jgi:death-on-curing protein